MQTLMFNIQVDQIWRTSSVSLPIAMRFSPVVLVTLRPDGGQGSDEIRLRLDLDKRIFIDPFPPSLQAPSPDAVAKLAKMLAERILLALNRPKRRAGYRPIR